MYRNYTILFDLMYLLDMAAISLRTPNHTPLRTPMKSTQNQNRGRGNGKKMV